MSRLSGLPGRRKKSFNFNFLSGRVIAIAVVLAVAALSFTLGYYAGGAGNAETVSETLQVPEGAGMVVLADGQACDDTKENNGSSTVGASTGATLETMTPLTPQPDERQSVASDDKQTASRPHRSEMEVAATAAKKTEQDSASAPAIDNKTVAKKAEPRPEEIKPEPKPKPVPKKTVAKKAVPKKTTAPKKKPASSVTVKSAAQGKTYSIQVGAFKSLGDAQIHKRRFTKKGYKASVYPDKGGSGQAIYKVRIGTYFDRKSADVMAQKLKTDWGASAFVTVIK